MGKGQRFNHARIGEILRALGETPEQCAKKLTAAMQARDDLGNRPAQVAGTTVRRWIEKANDPSIIYIEAFCDAYNLDENVLWHYPEQVEKKQGGRRKSVAK